MQELSVGIRNCLGYAVVSNILSLAPSFLFSMSHMECLRNKMLFGWGKSDVPNQRKEGSGKPVAKHPKQRWRSPVYGSRKFPIEDEAHQGEHWIHITLQLSTGNKDVQSFT